MESRHNGVQIKIICLWICCFVILILGGICTYILDQEVSESLVKTYALQQYDSVERIVSHMKEVYESKQPKDIDESFTSYIQEEKSSANAYWFLYTEDKILFEKDAMQTKLRDGTKLSDLINFNRCFKESYVMYNVSEKREKRWKASALYRLL